MLQELNTVAKDIFSHTVLTEGFHVEFSQCTVAGSMSQRQ